MYNKNFFDREDISTVNNNYLVNRLRLRYCYYIKAFQIFTNEHDTAVMCDNARLLMDESCFVDARDIFITALGIKISLNPINHNMRFGKDDMDFNIMNLAACMEIADKEKTIDDFKPSRYMSSEHFKIPDFNIDKKDIEKGYFELKHAIKTFLKQVLENTEFNIIHHGSFHKTIHIELKKYIDTFVDYFSLDILALCYSLATVTTRNSENGLGSLIYESVGAIKPKSSVDSLRKGINSFSHKGISNLICIEYASDIHDINNTEIDNALEIPLNDKKYWESLKKILIENKKMHSKTQRKKHFQLSPQFDSLFLYYVFNGMLEFMESDLSKENDIKNAIIKKIANMQHLGKNHPLIKYHIEQHFMMYTLYNLSKWVEKNKDIHQGAFISSTLYDIPFPLTRLYLSDMICNTEEFSMENNGISIIELKYYLYSISKKIYNAIKNVFKETDSMSIYMDTIESPLFYDITSYMNYRKMTYSEFCRYIMAALGYNQHSDKVLRDYLDFQKYSR